MVLSLWLASFVNFLPTYGFGLALVTGSSLYTRFRNSELQRTALEREWSAARLAALRMQLSPHTLFNLLHTIRGHIEWDPKGAQVMVVQLADLLRRLLNAGERDFSRLADELQFVRLYLELQQKRFADRLTVVLPPSSDIVDAWVPSLILQPLVENAVVHGLAGHQGPVTVKVSVKTANDVLLLRVTNTIAPGKLANARRRRHRHPQCARASRGAVRRPRGAHRRRGRQRVDQRNLAAGNSCLAGPARRPPRLLVGRRLMNVIIVDDELAGRRTLREMCEAEGDLTVIGEYGDGATALREIRGKRPQLLFLDIQMDPINGIDVARALAPEELPSLVFVTAYDSYALEAFEVSAVDYLLKPFDQERFRKTLARVRPRHQQGGMDDRQALLAGLLAQLERGARTQAEERPRLLAEFNGRLHVIDVTQVEMIEADRNYVLIRVGKDSYHTRSTLAQAEHALRTQPMLRISRSCLVNINYLREVNRTLRGDFILVLAGGATVTSSEGFRAKVKEHLSSMRITP